jgi:hypothetical protein
MIHYFQGAHEAKSQWNFAFRKCAQQSVPDDHRDNAPDAGDCPEGVRQSQAVFYALAFFWLDGFARSTRQGRSMQTVGLLRTK